GSLSNCADYCVDFFQVGFDKKVHAKSNCDKDNRQKPLPPAAFIGPYDMDYLQGKQGGNSQDQGGLYNYSKCFADFDQACSSQKIQSKIGYREEDYEMRLPPEAAVTVDKKQCKPDNNACNQKRPWLLENVEHFAGD
ncbi:MAG: hypothetical protein ACYSU3_23885, partial [Planctomycetota bacterium]